MLQRVYTADVNPRREALLPNRIELDYALISGQYFFLFGIITTMTYTSPRRARVAALALSASLFALSSSAFAQNRSASTEALDEIIVTGSPLTRSVDEAITGVSVLSGLSLIHI